MLKCIPDVQHNNNYFSSFNHYYVIVFGDVVAVCVILVKNMHRVVQNQVSKSRLNTKLALKV